MSIAELTAVFWPSWLHKKTSSALGIYLIHLTITAVSSDVAIDIFSRYYTWIAVTAKGKEGEVDAKKEEGQKEVTGFWVDMRHNRQTIVYDAYVNCHNQEEIENLEEWIPAKIKKHQDKKSVHALKIYT